MLLICWKTFAVKAVCSKFPLLKTIQNILYWLFKKVAFSKLDTCTCFSFCWDSPCVQAINRPISKLKSQTQGLYVPAGHEIKDSFHPELHQASEKRCDFSIFKVLFRVMPELWTCNFGWVDRRLPESGKKTGGGVAMFANGRWCNPGHVTDLHDTELLAVSVQTYYVPREFSHLFTAYKEDFRHNTDSCHIQKFSDDTAVAG